jgi:hypothetical protein
MRMLQTEPDRNTVHLEHGVGMAHDLLHLGLTHSAMHRADHPRAATDDQLTPVFTVFGRPR